MDFLNQTFKRWADQYATMAPGSRAGVGILVLLIAVSVVFLFCGEIAGSGDFLFGGQEYCEKELASMEIAFSKAKLNDYQRVGNRIRVPLDQRDRYLAALSDHNALPDQWYKPIEKMMDRKSYFTSSDELQEMARNARQEILSNVIAANDQIEWANVLVNEERSRGRFRQQNIKTALVSVRPVDGFQVSDEMAMTFRRSVAGAFSMDPSNVTVIDLVSSRSYCGKFDSEQAEGGNQYSNQQQRYQDQWRQKIENVLAYIPGVIVSTNVELSEDLEHEVKTRKPDRVGTVYETSEQQSSKDVQDLNSEFLANQPQKLDAKSDRKEPEKGTEKETFNRLTEKKMVGGTDERRIVAPLVPRLVKASIAIPSIYVRDIWKTRNPNASADDLGKIKKDDLEAIEEDVCKKVKLMAANIMPRVDGVDNLAELVQVSFFQSLTPPSRPEPTEKQKAIGWLLLHWETIGIFALVLIGLMVVRRALVARSKSKVSVSTSWSGDSEKSHKSDYEPFSSRLDSFSDGQFSDSGPSVKEELSERIHEDTEKAVNILQDWIGAAKE
jgi:flagellar M-ring protein FliF